MTSFLCLALHAHLALSSFVNGNHRLPAKKLTKLLRPKNMATPRLTFLYPIFYRGPIVTECGPLRTSVRQRPSRNSRVFSTTPARQDAVQQEEYKSGTELPPQVIKKKSPIGGNIQKSTKEKEHEKPREGRSSDKERPSRDTCLSEEKASSNAPEPLPKESQEVKAQETTVPPDSSRPSQLNNPIETVLSMPSPTGESPEEKPPHLQPPPYVHHFDTWSLVQDLSKGGFSQHQSTALMKAVRAILTDNMDLARRGLVSKSNVENETYLFQAACSELRTEIQNNRKAEMEKLRTQRAQLQHEVDILNQKMAQEISNLKDELKGMFDDRKMTARMDQRSRESRVRSIEEYAFVSSTDKLH